MKAEVIKKAAFALKVTVLLVILLLSKVARQEKELFEQKKAKLSAISDEAKVPAAFSGSYFQKVSFGKSQQ